MNLSRSRLTYALRVLVATVLATSAILVPAGIASAADTETPILTSFAVSDTQVTPGEKVTFSYAATEGSASLSRIRLGYEDALRHPGNLTFDNPPLVNGSVTITIPDTWANGLVALQWVELTDPSGNRITYSRWAGTSVSAGATGPTSHALPFAPGDMTVSGSTVDSTSPSLTSISASGSPAAPGQSISVHYVAADASGSLSSVILSFRDAFQIERVITAPGTGPFALSGVVDKVIPTTWPNGTYRLDMVRLADATGNTGSYLASGDVDYGPASFTVSGSTADFTPPVLKNLSLTGSPMAPGGSATLSYVADSQDPMAYVAFRYALRSDPTGRKLVFGAAKTQLTGTQTVTIPITEALGSYILTDVYLQDSAGNSISYNRDGTTSRTPGVMAGTHTFALNTWDIVVSTRPSAPPMVGAFARSTSAVVSWDSADPSGSPVTQYTVTAQPGGRTAVFSGSATYGELTGLTNDTVYHFTVTATNASGTSPVSAQTNAVTPRMSTSIIAGRDFTGDGRTDLIGLGTPTDPRDFARTPYLYRGNGLGGFASGGQKLSNPWGSFPVMFSSPDFNGDGKNDVFGIAQSGALFEFDGNGQGGFYPGMPIGSGWGALRSVFGPGDFSGDRKSDIMTVRKDGGLYLYRGNGSSGFTGAGQRIGTGWGTFLTVFSPGDFTGDGKVDLMAVSKDGGLYLYRGNGLGGFTGGGQRIGNGWAGFLSVFSPGDFTGDRKSDVMAVKSNGDLILYRGNGRGGWTGGGVKIGAGWGIFR